MNINTLYFRTALTITIVWIAVFAYLSYSGYREAYRSTEYAAYFVPDEEAYHCASRVLDATKSGFQLREPTSEERSSCYRQAAQEHLRLIEGGNQFALERAWKSFGWKGALPALLLLTVVAFWTFISTGLAHAASSYFNWLRFGSTKPDSESKSSEP